jgi:hypothetical protein
MIVSKNFTLGRGREATSKEVQSRYSPKGSLESCYLNLLTF